MSLELWLVRHGETAWSASGQHTSVTDVGLTEGGRRQAEAIGKFLDGKKFEAVFVSPRSRARETCRIAGYGDVAVVDDDLQEWEYGESEGKTTQEMQAIYPGWSVWTATMIGGETVEAVGVRADRVITRAVAAALRGGAVALFAHGHILRILAARWVGLEASRGQLLGLETGSVSVLGFEHQRKVIDKWNRGFEVRRV
ncbi:MAG: histidine phosphatase family protein [Acidobacteriaceae bacterium]